MVVRPEAAALRDSIVAQSFGGRQEYRMSTGDRREISASDAALYARLRLVGIVILVAGLAASAMVGAAAPAADDGAAVDAKRYEYEMELVGGKSNLFAAEVRGWFDGLLHGRGLWQLLAFVSLAGSFMCFFLAHRLKHFGPHTRPVGGRKS
jgi:hypothetical protein